LARVLFSWRTVSASRSGLGLALSFCGMVIALGIPAPATDLKQLTGDIMMMGAALFRAATTLTIKGELADPNVSGEK
jgi:drug/metabolite transporter (DMT)-like permease